MRPPSSATRQGYFSQMRTMRLRYASREGTSSSKVTGVLTKGAYTARMPSASSAEARRMCNCELAGVRAAAEAWEFAGALRAARSCELIGAYPGRGAIAPADALSPAASAGALSLSAAKSHKDASRMKRAPSRAIGQEPMVACACFGGFSSRRIPLYVGFGCPTWGSVASSGYRARPFPGRSPRFALWIFPMAGGPCAILSSTCDNEDSARAAKLPEMGLIG